MPGKHHRGKPHSPMPIEDSRGLLDTRQFVIVMFSLLSASGAATIAGVTVAGGRWAPAIAATAFLPAFFTSLAAMHALIRER